MGWAEGGSGVHLGSLSQSPACGRVGGLLAAVSSVDTRGQQAPSFPPQGLGPAASGLRGCHL